MSVLARRILVVSILVVLLAQMVPAVVFDLGHGIESGQTGCASQDRQTRDSARRVEEGGPPIVVSLNGGEPDSLPGFLEEETEKARAPSGSGSFQLASDSDPNITRVYWQNYTGDVQGDWVTWMQPGGKVRIWFKFKGPLSSSGPIITVWFGEVKSMSSAYGNMIAAADLNGIVEVGVNGTVWFYWTLSLPTEVSTSYGWGSGLVNAFTLQMYHPNFPFPNVMYYDGLKDKYSYLNMYGEIRVRSVAWYNMTGPAEIRVAQKGWYVSPWFTVSIDNAPVWDISFRTEWRGEVVWWPDSHIGWSAVNPTTQKIYPGEISVYPRPSPGSDLWLFYQVSPSVVYGSGIGETRGVYCKLFVSGVEFYSSNNEGALLYVVDKISNQAPQIDVIAPLDGEVFTESSLTLDAFVTDPNGNYDVDTLLVFVDGVSSNVKPDYSTVQGRLTTTVDIPQSGNVVNLTISAQDHGGLGSSATVLILSDNPAAYFPAGYVTSSKHYSLPFFVHRFEWEGRLSFEPGPEVNFTLTPRVAFDISCSVAFDIYTGTPQSVHSGENYTTYVMVSNPKLTLTIDFAAEMDYYLRLYTSELTGTATLFEKYWESSTALWLGVDVLDLRYDIPGVSEYIRKFTHYEIELLEALPIISEFASVTLSIDVVPLLKVSNVISADIAGLGCTTLLSKINLVGERTFAIQASVPSSASGSSCTLQLSNMAMTTRAGLDLSVNLWLSGAILSYTLMEVNLNEWLYNHLGIAIPSLSIWLPESSVPLSGSISIPTQIESQQLQVLLSGLSADESFINATVVVKDENANPVAGASVVATVGLETCTVTAVGGGVYRVKVPYRSTQFMIQITCSKAGYKGGAGQFDVYVDPMVVDSTAPSISGLQISPAEPTASDSVIVTASIVDALTGVVETTLFYSTNGGTSWSSLQLVLVSGSTYRCTIPFQSAGVQVLYYIDVSDGAGNGVATAQYSYTVKSAGSTTTTATSSTTTGPTGGIDPTMLIIGVAAIAGVAVFLALIVLMKRRSVSP